MLGRFRLPSGTFFPPNRHNAVLVEGLVRQTGPTCRNIHGLSESGLPDNALAKQGALAKRTR